MQNGIDYMYYMACGTWLSQEHRSAVSDVFVMSDSLSVLSADTAGVMKVWDAEHGMTTLSISGPVGHLSLAPNSQLAVSGDLHYTRLVYSLSYVFRPTFYDIYPKKINKIPEFYMIFARKNARILHNNCPKKIFSRFFFGGGAHALPAPVYTPMITPPHLKRFATVQCEIILSQTQTWSFLCAGALSCWKKSSGSLNPMALSEF